MTHGGDELGLHWSQPFILVGLGLGGLLVVFVELCDRGANARKVKQRFRHLTSQHDEKKPLDPVVEKRLTSWVNSPGNVLSFWSGEFLIRSKQTKDHYMKTYEMLALICALMLSLTVTFYTSGNTSEHLHGIVCCLANCALWMCTLMSAFFVVAFGTCQTDAHVDLLVGLYGTKLMRTPMVLFALGSVLVFLEFILYFKFTIDAKLSCSICLGGCGLFIPMFFHAMNKMGWAVQIVDQESNDLNPDLRTMTPTLEDLQTTFRRYACSKSENVLLFDRDEFMALSRKGWMQFSSVQETIAGQIFDAYAEAEIKKLGDFADPAAIRKISISDSQPSTCASV